MSAETDQKIVLEIRVRSASVRRLLGALATWIEAMTQREQWWAERMKPFAGRARKRRSSRSAGRSR